MLEACVRDAALVEIYDFEIVAEGTLSLDQVGDCFSAPVADVDVAFEREAYQAVLSRCSRCLAAATNFAQSSFVDS